MKLALSLNAKTIGIIHVQCASVFVTCTLVTIVLLLILYSQPWGMCTVRQKQKTMLFDRFLSLLVILILTSAAAGASWSTVWVAPERGKCQGRSPCTTLQHLWHQKTWKLKIQKHSPKFTAGVSNVSNTTWVFLPGVHEFPVGSWNTFQGANNLVLTGDEPCMRKKVQCTIKCNYLCLFLFIESRNITIQYLNVVYSNSSYLEVPYWLHWLTIPHFFSNSSSCNDVHLLSGDNITGKCNQSPFNFVITSWMFIAVSDVHIHSLHLVGYDSQFTVYNPRGQFEVIGSRFSQLSPATVHSYLKPNLAIFISYKPQTAETSESVNVLVSGCRFEADDYVPPYYGSGNGMKLYNHHAVLLETTTVGYMSRTVYPVLDYYVFKASVTVDNCTFLRTSGVDVQLTDSCFLLVTVEIVNSLVDGLAYLSNLHAWKFEHLEGSGVKIQVLRRNEIFKLTNTSSSVLVSGNCFQNIASNGGSGVTLRTVSVTLDLHLLCDRMVPIVIENNVFTNNWGLQYGSIIDAARTNKDGSSATFPYNICGHRPFAYPALVLRNNSLLHNKAQLSRCLRFNIAQRDHGHIKAEEWNAFTRCNAGDPRKGIIHLRGYVDIYFAALENNVISNNDVMGLSMIDSQVLFNGSNTLVNNYAPYGGGIFIGGDSQMLLMTGTRLHLLQNTAAFTGGGIFVSHTDTHPWQGFRFCFFDLVTTDGWPVRGMTSAAHLNVTVTLLDNFATVSGSSLFVTSMRPCMHPHYLQNTSQFEVFYKVFHLPSYMDEREMSSLPTQICSCNPSGPVNCFLLKNPQIQVFPGQSLDLWLMIVGEANAILSGDVTLFISTVSYQNITLFGMRGTLLLKHIKRFTNECNKVTITEESTAKILPGEYYIILSLPTLANTPFEAQKLDLVASMNMTVLDHCPHGYSMINSSSGLRCECHRVLQDNHITCHFSTLAFGLPPRYWIGASSDNTSLLFSDYCLPAYCRDVYTSKEVFLSNLTQQCLHGRVGTLCGECPEGQSVVLGSYNCLTCSNYGILVAVVYLVAGPLVIVFICFFNWTVSARSSNGLLLYLNVISINSDLLLTSNSFAFVVISWLNLQVGTEMCFFDRMDEFAKTILSFAFPLYLISLVALIVVLSKCINMHRINKLIGPRITPVLATVIFLSYTMLAESVLKSLLFAQLCSTDGGCTPVWLLDGSLNYFSSIKHIILGCMALTILFVLLIPITLTAIIGDLFRRCISNRWYMNFLDTFHSSYRFRWGFWMGLRLVMRIVLLLLKVTVKPEVVWLVTACFSLSLAAVQSLLKPFRHLRFERFTHRLVDQWCSSDENGRTVANYLDISFLVNLTALFLCISYLPDSAEVFISLSLCVALMEMLLILAYHLVEYSPLWPPLLRATTNMVERVRMFWLNMRHTEEQCESADNHQLLGLPLVLRAADCTDESYESSPETSEGEAEHNADDH